jgi:hypothetical protein
MKHSRDIFILIFIIISFSLYYFPRQFFLSFFFFLIFFSLPFFRNPRRRLLADIDLVDAQLHSGPDGVPFVQY